MLSIFGINEKWRSWIRACVFYSNFLVLVNGFLAQEISIQKGLNLGDPLALFLFLLVAEGISDLVTKAVKF